MDGRSSRGGTGEAPWDGLSVTRIEDTVVLKLVGIAAREIEGVEMRRNTALPAFRGLYPGGEAGGDLTLGVSAEVGEAGAAVDLTVAVEFGCSIPRVTDAVRCNVVRRVEGLAGLAVRRVDVNVVDVVVGGA